MNHVTDLGMAELLTARLCHELSSPIAAIGNGVELLGEDDPDFSREALALVADSARRAANRLQFYRFAYGFGGSAAIAGPEPGELAIKLFERTSIACEYSESIRALPLAQQKLGCNLLLVGAEALVRGGRLALGAAVDGLQLEVVGEPASLAPEQRAALQLETPVGAVTSRTAQAYFSGLLARALGWRLVAAAAGPARVLLLSVEAVD
jgi:histidine phosphotransferase ChpT